MSEFSPYYVTASSHVAILRLHNFNTNTNTNQYLYYTNLAQFTLKITWSQDADCKRTEQEEHGTTIGYLDPYPYLILRFHCPCLSNMQRKGIICVLINFVKSNICISHCNQPPISCHVRLTLLGMTGSDSAK